MNLEQRIKAFVQLGDFLSDFTNQKEKSDFSEFFKGFEEVLKLAYVENGWFTQEYIYESLKGIIHFCKEEELQKLVSQIEGNSSSKTVATIMAGNIPAVGFHDMLCVLLSGHKILLKLSSDDKVLISFFVRFLSHVQPEFQDYIRFSSGTLSQFDAIIATGSNNSSRYFEYYFGKYPHIIRKNRFSVAVLDGTETNEELSDLGKDVFTYFGLGCRNVSKLLVPKGYDFKTFFEAIFSFSKVIENKKYGNNYDYNRAVYLLNKEPFLDNNFLILKQDSSWTSPVSVLFYEEYDSIQKANDLLEINKESLQVVVSKIKLDLPAVPFGQAQKPGILDFADNVNTMRFISAL